MREGEATSTVLLGLPASGKSTLARLIAEPEEVVSSDRARAALGAAPGDPAADGEVVRAVLATCEWRFEHGQRTVVDSTGALPGLVEGLLAAARRWRTPLEVVHCDAPLDECIARDARRREGRRVGREGIERLAQVVQGTLDHLAAAQVPVVPGSERLGVAHDGRSVFIGMPITEHIGDNGFRPDRRALYEPIHDALRFVGLRVESAAVNEDYGAISLPRAEFTRYDVDELFSCDVLLVVSASTISPDIYLEVGIALGQGKPVGMILPNGGRATEMMRGLVELGLVRRRGFEREHDLPRLAVDLAAELLAEAPGER